MKLILSQRQSPDQVKMRTVAAPALGVDILDLPWRIDENMALDLAGDSTIRIYAEHLFADVIAQQLGLGLLEAPLDWLTQCPQDFTHRNIRAMTAGKARFLAGPVFIKHMDDKLLEPRVYAHGSQINTLVTDDQPVMVSDPANWSREVRLFVLDGEIYTGSDYVLAGKLQTRELSKAEIADCQKFVDKLYADPVSELIPRATVLDLAVDAQHGWSVIELNAAWGSGIYACDPVRALEVILHASCPIDRVVDSAMVRCHVAVEW